MRTVNEIILGIETSCDETSAAVVAYGAGKFQVLSNVISSQIDTHKQYGGVIPEIASRMHCENIIPVLEIALQKANVTLDEITMICATKEPGLPGAVMVGRVFGESLAAALDVPYAAVNHLSGHIASLYLSNSMPSKYKCLLVSGGHTQLYEVREKNGKLNVKLLIQTADDAVGECFDKVGRKLGLEYPAGEKISKLAKEWHGEIIKFCEIKKLSYSGLKTSVLNYINAVRQKGEAINLSQICKSFEVAAIGQLLRLKPDAVCGGVSANSYLRECLPNAYFPLGELCGDNGVMIAAAGVLFSGKNE
ncbi:MAG: tRNA (adenosine(37)-N6)-threonylcarbamoyltransferase complex transferase subunit TsaD [Christensenellaceae bacterium]|jgi:N6-L-threonylcarbamoyladenine synthase|nr:tRNA (adenosine(37)-N6)-threonylcarbamoyltransferase complex transferase subunit TsaD [Christensenellaceae bacterium]